MFHDTYLAGRSLVLEALERENNIGLVTTNRTLMGLRHFFNFINSGRIEEAWGLLKQFELLPNSSPELPSRLSKYHSLDPVLKDAFPAVVKGAMVCLHRFHSRAKQNTQGSPSIAQSQLKKLQDNARILTTFSGQAQLPRDMQVAVSRLEAQMV